MNRKLLWAVLGIGVALVVTPFAMSLPTKAAAGQRMMNGFQPIMQPAQVQATDDYYRDVFVPLGTAAATMSEDYLATFKGYLNGLGGVRGDAERLMPMLADSLNLTGMQVRLLVAREAPAMAGLLVSLPAMQRDLAGLIRAMQAHGDVLARVPAALDHYEPLVTTVQANADNYREANSLPDFRLFTIFFVVPGALLILIALWGLCGAAVTRKAAHRHHPRPTPA